MYLNGTCSVIGGTTADQCPVIRKITPPYVHIDDTNTPMVIEMSTTATGTVECRFTAPPSAGSIVFNQTASAGGTIVTCPTPPTLYIGVDWLVEVIVNGEVYTDAKRFEVYSTISPLLLETTDLISGLLKAAPAILIVVLVSRTTSQSAVGVEFRLPVASQRIAQT